MGRFRRAAPSLLLHVNLLLMMYAGAALSTAARLRWDPSLYVAARELFPLEYRACAAALPVLAIALLLLAHLALTATQSRQNTRRTLFIMVGSGQLVVICSWVGVSLWAWRRGVRWADGAAAAQLKESLSMREHLMPLLHQLAQYHPLPDKITALIEEAESDLPSNLHVLLCAAALLALLQLSATVLAFLSAAPRRANVSLTTPSSPSGDVERAPLRSAFRNGRLVLL